MEPQGKPFPGVGTSTRLKEPNVPHEEMDDLLQEKNEAADYDDGTDNIENPPIEESSGTSSQYPRLDVSQGEEPLGGGEQETGQNVPQEFVCTPNSLLNFLPNDGELVCTPRTGLSLHDTQEHGSPEVPYYGAEPIAESQQEMGHASQELVCTSASLPTGNAQNGLVCASNPPPNVFDTPDPTTETFSYMTIPEEEAEYSNEKEEYTNPYDTLPSDRVNHP